MFVSWAGVCVCVCVCVGLGEEVSVCWSGGSVYMCVFSFEKKKKAKETTSLTLV